MDIREQFPLDEIADAIGIADACGIRYPYDNVSGFPYVLTTDFLITVNGGYVARAIKPKTELQKLRVREKLEIERRYWLKRNVEWRIITEDEIPNANQGLKAREGGRKTAQKSRECKYVANKSHNTLLRCLRQ